MARAYVLVTESGRPLYFKLLALGLFWEGTHDVNEARQFSSRPAASKVLRENGKNRQGWRVVPIERSGQ
jgi:hypothetical protein